MQAGGWRVGSIFGIPLLIDSSWFFVLIFFGVVNGLNLQARYPEWGSTLPWILGPVMALLLFGSVLLHELGHSLVARSQGITVNSIKLFMFGGVATIDRESSTPGRAFQVAIAGPLVSFALFVILGAIVLLVLPPNQPPAILLGNLAQINLVLALFNLIPGLPLDGGQVLKALVWKATGNRFTGIHWAARTGQLLGWVAVVLGLAVALTVPGGNSAIWIALLGWFCVSNASAYDRMTSLQEKLLSLKVAEAMTRDFRVVDGEISLREFVETYLLVPDRPVFFAATQGRYQGLVPPEALQTIERQQWDRQQVQDLAVPFSQLVTIPETWSLAQAIDYIDRQQATRLTVMTPAGAVAGIVDHGDMVQALTRAFGVPCSAAEVKRIKEEGRFPNNLPLVNLARSALDDTGMG